MDTFCSGFNVARERRQLQVRTHLYLLSCGAGLGATLTQAKYIEILEIVFMHKMWVPGTLSPSQRAWERGYII